MAERGEGVTSGMDLYDFTLIGFGEDSKTNFKLGLDWDLRTLLKEAGTVFVGDEGREREAECERGLGGAML